MYNAALDTDIDIKERIETSIDAESQVIVHASFDATDETFIRIWSSTFLVDRVTGHRSKLTHLEGVPLAPQWMSVPAGYTARFTLLFTGLPKGCTHFDLIEDIPQSGGFFVKNIRRNSMDVYQVSI